MLTVSCVEWPNLFAIVWFHPQTMSIYNISGENVLVGWVGGWVFPLMS